MILACSCLQPYQDQLHGRGMRVHNQLKSREKARCTGCGTVHMIGTVVVPVKKEEDGKKDKKGKL